MANFGHLVDKCGFSRWQQGTPRYVGGETKADPGGILQHHQRRVVSSRPVDLEQHSRPVNPAFASLVTKNRKRRRSAELVAAVQKLDTATDPESRRELSDWVRSLYEAQDLADPVALFSRCYLGQPYLDHVMTLEGSILTHFTRSDEIPAEYESARALARSDAYAFIEIYDDGTVVPIRDSGDPVI